MGVNRAFKPLHERYEIAKNGCWLWTSGTNTNGYGKFSVNGKSITAHRYFYEFYHSTRVPPGMVLDHLCMRKRCVNPAHLEIVTQQENAKRFGPNSHNAKKTECPQGHPYSEDNVYLGTHGDRICRTCTKLRDKERYAKYGKPGRY